MRQLVADGGGWQLRALNPAYAETALADLSPVRGVVIQKSLPGRRRAQQALRRLAMYESPCPISSIALSRFPIRRLEMAGSEESFRAASARTKALRASPDLPAGCVVRMVIFADSELEAEDLL